MMILARRIKRPLDVTIDRLQCSDACELDRPVVFGRLGQKVGRRQDLRHVAFGFGDDLGEVPDRVAKRRQLGAIVQHDRFGKP